jgi:hypothetical protein
MGMYCACGVKKTDDWQCECDWSGWYLCFEIKEFIKHAPVKEIPEKQGQYLVRTFEDGDYHEEESEFSLIKKNWGESTNQAVSHWKIEYQDGWLGYRGVYAWKEKIVEILDEK